ncbi:potassium channel family protein [Novosphingobium aquae]|uniref:Potassium channel family protein n=1 Tax=Novosphingobium aquae TaxID=3133435 RepID=A0ABU8SCU2_9SPHN
MSLRAAAAQRRLSLEKADRFHPLRRRASLRPWQSLLVRVALVLALMGVALAVHWFDRDGLRDNIDGQISFIDAIYFTTITITTVGYGDIVPISDQAKLFESFVVTPIRVFVWLIFLGTAYDFVFRNSIDRIRSAMIRNSLKNHTIICGYGAGGTFAARELVAGGAKADSIVIVDPDPLRIAAATAEGFSAIEGDATHNSVLKAARIGTACAVLVSTSRDDATALVVLSARQLNPHVQISATARLEENEDLLAQAGANVVLNPIRMGGHMLARAAADRHAVDTLADLASADHGLLLRERPARPAEIGQRLDQITGSVALKLVRGEETLGFWENPVIMAGDGIVEVIQAP